MELNANINMDISFIGRMILEIEAYLHEYLYKSIFNKEAIWLYAELFLGHHDGSCHGLW